MEWPGRMWRHGVTPTFRTQFVWYILYPYFTSNGTMSGPRWVHVVRYLASNLRPEPLHTSPQFGMFDDNVTLFGCVWPHLWQALLEPRFLTPSSASARPSSSASSLSGLSGVSRFPRAPSDVTSETTDASGSYQKSSVAGFGRLGMLGKGGFSLPWEDENLWKIIGFGWDMSQICCG